VKKKSSKKEIEESLKSFRTLNEKLQKEDEKNIIDKILTMVFTIDGFALIVCFLLHLYYTLLQEKHMWVL